MSNAELKPCPFCGGKAVVIETFCKETNYRGYYVYHGNCLLTEQIETNSYDTEKSAIAAWNRRAGNE